MLALHVLDDLETDFNALWGNTWWSDFPVYSFGETLGPFPGYLYFIRGGSQSIRQVYSRGQIKLKPPAEMQMGALHDTSIVKITNNL